MTTNATGLAGCLALLALWSGPAGAQAQPADRVVLDPHRAVYDLVLDAGKAAKNVDSARGRIAFDVEPADPQLPGLVESNELTAVAYLDSVKLQFDLQGLVLVRSPRATALQARLGIPVVETIAVKREGAAALLAQLEATAT